jgi:hypothetical protein
MRTRWSTVLLLLISCLVVPAFGVDGMFQGRVVDPPPNQPGHGWIYVQGRNHLLRRVEVSQASIVFSDSIPASQHHKCDMECLVPGQEVRVTAVQDSAGEWRAKRVEILKLTTART